MQDNDTLDETHDPALRSWVDSANDPATDFPIQNLPFGVFRHVNRRAARIGVAIGDRIFDLHAASIAQGESLNGVMFSNRSFMREVRRDISRRLRADATPGPDMLVPMAECEMLIPAQIGDY